MRNKQQALYTIKFVLDFMGKNTKYAPELIYEVMNVESNNFQCNTQMENGPARGYIQMEMATFYDIVDNYLKYRPELMRCFETIRNKNMPNDWDLRMNVALQIFMCRCHFLRVRDPIPSTKKARAKYWVDNYNCGGKGTVKHYMDLN